VSRLARPISSLANYRNGYPVKPEDVSDIGLPIVRIRQLLDKTAPCDLFEGHVPDVNRINDGDLIFSWSATLGCRYWTRGPAVLNQHLFRVDPVADVDKRWLRWALTWSIDAFRPFMHGSAMTHITRSMMKAVRVPCPPSRAQVTIADFLDRECDRIAVALASLDAPVVTASRLPTQRLLEAIAALGARDERLRFGMMSLSQGWSPECWDRERGVDEWGVLKLGCVNGGVFTPDHKTLPPDVGPRPELEVLMGDLLMSRANTRSLVGSAAVVSPDVGPRLMVSDLLYRLRLDPDRWHPPYVAAVLNSPVGRTQLEAAASGSAGSMPKISQEVIRQLRLPRPGVDEQRIAADAFRDDDDQVRDLAAIADRVRAALTAYRSSLIHEAVTGKLDVTAASDRQMDERLHAAAEGRLDEVPV
jgi:type I restriction enzyme S subunit